MRNTRNSPDSNLRFEIRLAGSGGQGIVLAGIILAEAAILDERQVTQTQSYGPEARGGNSVSEVIVSKREIDFPRATALDLLVALTQEACDRNLPDMKDEGLVITDSDQVPRVLWGRSATLPFGQIAQRAGEERAINMAALGAVGAFCPLISCSSLAKVIKKRLPSDKVEVNLKVFDEALKIAQKLKKNLTSVEIKDEFEF